MNPTSTLFRDDDVNVYTDVYLFWSLHQEFIKREKIHKVAVLMKDIWENHAPFYYLATAPYLEVELHGWEHKDYSQLTYMECYSDLMKSLVYWNENALRMTGGLVRPITTFFAPWNHEGEGIKQACNDLALKFCAVKKGEWDGKYVNSFHHWYLELHPEDIPKLFK